MSGTGRVVVVGLVLAALVAGCPCRKRPEPPAAPPMYAFCIEANPKLNWYKNQSHTLYLRLFQLSSLDAFNQADPARLLEPGVVLPGMEGSPIERTVYPGTTATLEIRRGPAAQHLGAVAGYYDPQGRIKTSRALGPPPAGDDDDDDEKDKKKKKTPCMVLGPNAIEIP